MANEGVFPINERKTALINKVTDVIFKVKEARRDPPQKKRTFGDIEEWLSTPNPDRYPSFVAKVIPLENDTESVDVDSDADSLTDAGSSGSSTIQV